MLVLGPAGLRVATASRGASRQAGVPGEATAVVVRVGNSNALSRRAVDPLRPPKEAVTCIHRLEPLVEESWLLWWW
jgi:hypothetical protein